MDEYYAIIKSEECIPAGFAVNPNVAIVLPLMCHEDEETAIERGLEGAYFFRYSLAHHYNFGHHRPAITNIWDEFQQNLTNFAESQGLLDENGLKKIGAIGTPDQVRELIRGYEEAGVDQIIFVSQAGKNKHEHICESMELFAREVMPEFQEREGAHQVRKQEGLEEAISAALKRREPAREAAKDYVVRPPSFRRERADLT